MTISQIIFVLSLSCSVLMASPADEYPQALKEAESLYTYLNVSQTEALVNARAVAYKARNILLEEAAKLDPKALKLQQQLFKTAKERKGVSSDTEKINAHLRVQKNIVIYFVMVLKEQGAFAELYKDWELKLKDFENAKIDSMKQDIAHQIPAIKKAYRKLQRLR